MQLKPFVVSFQMAYTQNVKIHVLTEDENAAQYRVSQALKRGSLWDLGDRSLYVVDDRRKAPVDQALVFDVRAAIKSDARPRPSVRLMRLNNNARTLLSAAQNVVNSWEKGDLAAAVCELDSAVQECSRTR